MNASGSLLEVNGLAKRFDQDGETEPLEILAGIDLTLERGATMAVMGPSGSGKSTLLHVIGGLLPPSAGRVLLRGRDLAALGTDELARVRNREIGFVFQDHHLLPQCTVIENVMVPTLADPRAGERDTALARARELLEKVGLQERLGHLPARLSGGERQRVALVRALIMQPELLLADEPTGALDAHTSDELIELLCALNADEGTALLAVTHSERLARRMARVLELRDGHLQPGEGAP